MMHVGTQTHTVGDTVTQAVLVSPVKKSVYKTRYGEMIIL